MIDSKIERVARALCKADGFDPDERWNANGNVQLDVLIPWGMKRRWRYIYKARAAIEAMGEPAKHEGAPTSNNAS
jgi:hypothetical protein